MKLKECPKCKGKEFKLKITEVGDAYTCNKCNYLFVENND